jgi:methyltransferase (TIGR00027 family)
MTTPDTEIYDVTDTALWVAAHRALESRRSDAAFHDPLAEVLVGDRGHAIRQAMPGTEVMQWVMVMRTVAIDRLILNAIARGADTVINLGAGLDTRPYRLALPGSLRWIEIDLPNIIELKTARLKSHAPACKLEHIALDLSQREQRQRVLADIAARSRSIVVLTEGLLPYLTPANVEALADDLQQTASVNYWVQDYYQGKLSGGPFRGWRKKLKAAPLIFEVEDWFGFFKRRGWVTVERILLIEEAQRLKRRPPLKWWHIVFFLLTPPSIRRKQMQRGGYVMLEKSGVVSTQDSTRQ